MHESLLIAHGWQQLVQWLSLLLFLNIVFMIGFLSRKLENALFFTFSTTVVILALFIVT
jgi:hypothetical protein